VPPKHLQERTAIGSRSTTLVGEKGQEVTRALVGHVLGLNSLSKLGPAAGYADDGTLLLHVDEATFDALDLNGND